MDSEFSKRKIKMLLPQQREMDIGQTKKMVSTTLGLLAKGENIILICTVWLM